MKRYNEKEKCPMCGFNQIQDKFMAKGEVSGTWFLDGGYSFKTHYDRAVIVRTCLRCSYKWEVEPLRTPGKWPWGNEDENNNV